MFPTREYFGGDVSRVMYDVSQLLHNLNILFIQVEEQKNSNVAEDGRERIPVDSLLRENKC